MKITFLGTGTSQGIPVIGCDCKVCMSDDLRDKRLRTSVYIETDDAKMVIDTGPDFRQQMLREKIKHIDAILLTHEHKDHIAGLDDIRSYNYFQQKPMDIYASGNVMKALKNEYAYIFAKEKYPGIPQVILHYIDKEPFKINQTEIIPIDVVHLQMPVKGFRTGKLGYITDASFIPDAEKLKLHGLDILVINALRAKPHISHFNLAQALAIIEELKPKKAFLIHMSHQFGLYAEMETQLPVNVFISYDGLSVEC